MEVRTDADRILEQAVERGAAAGVVAIAGNPQGVVYEGAFGVRAAGGTDPMTVDTVFWMASMTKAVTSVAALQQVEHGRLALDEPISNVLPQLKEPKVLEGFDASGQPYVVLDFSPDAIAAAKERGTLFLEGRGSEDEDLEKAGIDRAKGLLPPRGRPFSILNA